MARIRKPPTKSNKRESIEWIGGVLSPPFLYKEDGDTVRSKMAIWLELPSDLIVGHEMVGPKATEGSLGRALQLALREPPEGSSGKPDRIRVADPERVKELRKIVGGSIPITVAPTPELDMMLELMAQTMSSTRNNASYFEGGRISAELLEDLFRNARALYSLAPWKVALDEQLLRVDIPELEVDGACLSIIGNLGESEGLLIFPSIEAYDSFHIAAMHMDEGGGPIDLGTDWLALDFDTEAEVPASMRQEVADHNWPLAGPGAYPMVTRREPDGRARPLEPRDMRIASACASAFTAFFLKHGSMFRAETLKPVSESYFDSNDLKVRITAPFDGFELFDSPISPEARSDWEVRLEEVGRNEACPCGSGRKYKKCHMPEDQGKRSFWRGLREIHRLDVDLLERMSDFANERFGSDWLRYERDFKNAREVDSLAPHWSVYHFHVEGKTVLEHFLEEHGRNIPDRERAVLETERNAWLSVWEVTDVEAGESFTLRDILSGEVRHVHEAAASRGLERYDGVLGRLIDHGEVTLLSSLYPRPLPPEDVAEVVLRARKKLRRKQDVPIERLRDESFGRALIRYWEEALEDLLERLSTPPTLSNTDGDPFLMTTDHFGIEPGAFEAIRDCIAAMPDTDAYDPEDETVGFDFLRKREAGGPLEGSTHIGRITFSESRCRIVTNSINRADSLRGRVEKACHGLIRHLLREHSDPLSEALPAKVSREDFSPIQQEELDRLSREYKMRHYQSWPDEPLPALEGRTPREAVSTKEGRAEVDLLLKRMENMERRQESDAAFDFSILRKELGLD